MMKQVMMATAIVALTASATATAQVQTHVTMIGAVRNHTTQVCTERAKSIALTLDMTSGGDALSTWLVRPGSATTTMIRCDLPEWVVITTAGPNWSEMTEQNKQIAALYNKIGGN